MAVRVHEVDVAAERGTLLDLLESNLSDYGGPPHFDWLYLGNPWGKARAWIAEDERTGDPVGVAAAFPRRLHLKGREQLCWNLGDFAIRAGHRHLDRRNELRSNDHHKSHIDEHVLYLPPIILVGFRSLLYQTGQHCCLTERQLDPSVALAHF